MQMAKPARMNWSALAGWLFADLALVLAFVFLDSTAQGTASQSNEVATTTTTTVLQTTTTVDISTGADPEPIVIEIAATVNTDADTLQQRLESEISRSGDPRANQRILVVIIGGGGLGSLTDPTREGTAIAINMREKIRDWSRIVAGKTYFQVMGENSLPIGQVRFKLFPIAD
jgi:hypothetical protein